MIAAPPAGLPPPLLNAVAQANGKVVLVLGAGCSFPPPTSVPMAKRCSQDAYRKLTLDGVLADGDCSDPDDLSVLAETVFEKCGRQSELVERLPHEQFRRARANSGYLTAAALLRENVISSILTLNFDLAMEDALTQLGALSVHQIARPEDMPHFVAHNVIYLHRNVNELNPEKWVLRTSVLASEWEQGWEGLMAQVVLTGPVVTFAGLGSPAAVLIETTRRIKQRLGALDVYQVDPSALEENAFFRALALPPEAFVRLGWNEFMALLSDRVLAEQVDILREICSVEAQTEGFDVANVDVVIERLRRMGLVEVGKVRAAWMSLEECYTVHTALNAPLLAHMVIAASAVAQMAGAQDVVIRSEVIEFRAASGASLTCAMMACGRGVRGWSAMEAEVRRRRASIPRHDPQPRFAVIGGATGLPLRDIVAPLDIVADPRPAGDIVHGETDLALFSAHEVSRSPDMLRAVL
jgi:hypothetical protein